MPGSPRVHYERFTLDIQTEEAPDEASLVFLKLFLEAVRTHLCPLTTGLLSLISADARLQDKNRSQLDRVYQRVIDDRDTLVRALGHLKSA